MAVEADVTLMHNVLFVWLTRGVPSNLVGVRAG